MILTSRLRWQRIQDLFEKLESMAETERAAYLEQEEPLSGVREEALRLLESAQREKQATLLLRGAEPSSPGPSASIDGFRILCTLGSGGFSTVYAALRSINDVEQRVAVKLFHAHRLGLDGRRRFEREQKMLAALNHAAIVRFLGAGITEQGQPYLVMEEVEGLPITEHSDKLSLPIEPRLRLILDACMAVQHAHQKLIVHLDLKPSNILVTKDGEVKLLDFGTAKLLDETGALTVTQQLTPIYASPERLRGEAGSVSSDIYGLGLILFELLSGGLPFPGRYSIPAIASRAQGSQEARPLSSVPVPEDAAARGTNIERLRKVLSGDLRSICAKALAHEPAERYASVTELVDDICRYLDGEPVRAHPPGFFYRAGKFARRNVRALTLSAVTAIVLLGAGVYVWRGQIKGAQRLEEARAMAKYLLFDLYDQVIELPGSTGVRARMAEQAQTHLDRLASLSGADLELRLDAAAGYNRLAEIQGISGSSSTGNTHAATANLDKSRMLTERILVDYPGNRTALIEQARNALLSAKLQNWNRRNTAAARPLIDLARRALDRARDPGDSNWLRARASLAVQSADLAEFERDFAREKQIASLALQELANWPAGLRGGADYVLRRVVLLKRHGNADYYQNQFRDALASYQQARQLLLQVDAHNPNRPEVLYALADMGYQVAYSFGELKDPLRMLDSTRESLGITAKLLEYDRENQALRRSYWNKRQALAESLTVLGRLEEAVREQNAVLEARKAARHSQPDSALAQEDIVVTQATFAGILVKAGNLSRACPLARETIESSRALNASGAMTAKNWSEQKRMLDPVLALCAVR